MKKTKLIIYTLFISLSGILLFSGASVRSAEKWKWTGTYADATVMTREDLDKILADHKKWIDTKEDKGIRANLSWCDLSEASLSYANLSKANLSHAKLIGTDLSYANLRYTDLSHAKLINSNLTKANLTRAYLANATLKETDLLDATISYANFKKSVFEPLSIGKGLGFLGASGFSSMTFDSDKIWPVVTLRKMARESSFKSQERRLTAALRKNREKKRFLETLFLDLPSGYGADPGRCLLILGAFFFIFSIPYIFSLMTKGEEGIWMEWVTKRMKKKMGNEEPFRLKPHRWYKVIGYGVYFSLLSAFHIGWKDLNVGSWIARIQPREYTLKATGWVRVVSGIHSLISIYLLALWALTQFGRPFE